MKSRRFICAMFFAFVLAGEVRAGCEDIIHLMSAQSPTIAGKWTTPLTSERTYRVLLTYFKLPTDGSLLAAFFRSSGEIQKQLESSPGLIGYSMHADLGSQQFW